MEDHSIEVPREKQKMYNLTSKIRTTRDLQKSWLHTLIEQLGTATECPNKLQRVIYGRKKSSSSSKSFSQKTLLEVGFVTGQRKGTGLSRLPARTTNYPHECPIDLVNSSDSSWTESPPSKYSGCFPLRFLRSVRQWLTAGI